MFKIYLDINYKTLKRFVLKVYDFCLSGSSYILSFGCTPAVLT